MRWYRIEAECTGFVTRMGNHIASSNLATSSQSFYKANWLSIQYNCCRRSADLPAFTRKTSESYRRCVYGSPLSIE